MLHYLNGKWVAERDMHISVFDLSVIRGYGIFDFLRTYKRNPFQLSLHIDRLFTSAKILGMTIPKTKAEIERIVLLGIKKNPGTELAIKLVVTGGISTDGITPGKPSFLIIFTKAPIYPETNYSKGVRISTYDYLRFLPSAKSLNYFTAVYVMQQAARERAVEVLYVDEKGCIQECTRSNVFFVKKGIIYTPPEQKILKGITRRVVFDIAKQQRMKIMEKSIRKSELQLFDECFITGSTIEILPVVTVDKRTIGNGKVGQLTKEMMVHFHTTTQSS